jgi:cell division protein FtsL
LFFEKGKQKEIGTVMTRNRFGKKKAPIATEFHTVKRIDNSRLVHHVEPLKMRNLYRTVALGGLLAAFLTLYVYQHFRCIDLSFQLESAKAQQADAAALNSSLTLQIAGLSDPRRIDLIARQQLGLTEVQPAQVQEYETPSGAEVAAVRYARANRP